MRLVRVNDTVLVFDSNGKLVASSAVEEATPLLQQIDHDSARGYYAQVVARDKDASPEDSPS